MGHQACQSVLFKSCFLFIEFMVSLSADMVLRFLSGNLVVLWRFDLAWSLAGHRTKAERFPLSARFCGCVVVMETERGNPWVRGRVGFTQEPLSDL